MRSFLIKIESIDIDGHNITVEYWSTENVFLLDGVVVTLDSAEYVEANELARKYLERTSV